MEDNLRASFLIFKAYWLLLWVNLSPQKFYFLMHNCYIFQSVPLDIPSEEVPPVVGEQAIEFTTSDGQKMRLVASLMLASDYILQS